METEYLYPVVGDRVTPTQWAEYGSKDMWQRAREKVQTLMQHFPTYVTEEQDLEIRDQFDIQLRIEDMTARAGRWA